MIRPALVALVLACALSTGTLAKEPLSWRACAMDFVRNTVDLGDLRLDVPPERLGPNAKLMAKIIAKDGLAAAGLQVHVAYAVCTEPLGIKGIPVELGEKLASECAAGAVIRLAALRRMLTDATLEQLKEGAPEEGRSAIEFLYKMAQDFSFTKAVWASLESGLTCIDQARR